MPRHQKPVEHAARDRLHRLAAAGSGGALTPGGADDSDGAVWAAPTQDGTEHGWVPGSPPLPDDDDDDDDDDDVDDDVADVVARTTSAALAAAATAYSAEHGHPLEHRHPGTRGRRRWHLSVRLAVIAGVAVAVLGAGVAARATLATESVTATDAGAGAAGSDRAAAPSSATGRAAAAVPTGASSAGTRQLDQTGLVVVHVVGQVQAPGLVELPAGSRVSDAVAAAGGATPAADLAALNLARVVVDGEQIVVPAPGQPVAAQNGPTATAGGGKPSPIDLNSADAAALDALPGIGPVLAQRVLDWRAAHGRFTDVAELGEVPGIGDALLAKLRDLVRV